VRSQSQLAFAQAMLVNLGVAASITIFYKQVNKFYGNQALPTF
jgi:hypothetical protein